MSAALLLCLVVAITDGDTIKMRCDDHPQVVILLAEVDAPEKRQPLGQRSRDHLAALCFQQRARIVPTAVDRYGRTVARVSCRGRDAGAEQVRASTE
jgi:endonuclease YncB( thermonuclease family)